MTRVVHLNGWPGTGKLTIARPLAQRLEARLIDNHTLLNPAEALFERNDPNWEELRGRVRSLALDYALRIPLSTALVLTDALADSAYDKRLFDEYRILAARRSARLVAVILECEPAENGRRLASRGRSELLKLTRPDILADLRSKWTLLRPDSVDLIEVDVTALTPDRAVDQILRALPN